MSTTNSKLGAILNILRANDISNAGVRIDEQTGRVTLLKGVGKEEMESFIYPEGDEEALEVLVLERMR
jgi:hypothetical protein